MRDQLVEIRNKLSKLKFDYFISYQKMAASSLNSSVILEYDARILKWLNYKSLYINESET